MAASLNPSENIPRNTTSESTSDPSYNQAGGVIKCRKCRQVICVVTDIIPHKEGIGQTAFSWHKRSNETNSSLSLKTEDFVSIQHSNITPSTTSTDGVYTFDQLSKLNLEFDESSGGYILTDNLLADLTNQTYTSVSTVTAPPKNNLLFASLNPKCKSFFIQRKEWMDQSVLGTNQGKLNCPKCHGRLGSFNWSGMQCSCGQWVTPSFQIHKARIDLLTSDI